MSGYNFARFKKGNKFCQTCVTKKFNYFDYINTAVKQQVHQGQYFMSKSCALLLSSDHPCKSCHEENIKFNKEINYKKSVLTAPTKLNASIKFTSP